MTSLKWATRRCRTCTHSAASPAPSPSHIRRSPSPKCRHVSRRGMAEIPANVCPIRRGVKKGKLSVILSHIHLNFTPCPSKCRQAASKTVTRISRVSNGYRGCNLSAHRREGRLKMRKWYHSRRIRFAISLFSYFIPLQLCRMKHSARRGWFIPARVIFNLSLQKCAK